MAPLYFPGSILTNVTFPMAFHTIVCLARTKMMTRYVCEHTCLRRTRQTVNTDDGIHEDSVDRLPGNGSIQASEFVNKWIDLLDVTKCKP